MALAADAPNRCDVPDDNAEKKSEIIHMSRFVSVSTPAEHILRTAKYTEDPKAYLETTLGSETYNERKSLLCIPDKIDKDVYGNGEHMFHLQRHIAKHLGKQHGCFFITGVQAQLAAVKVHCERAGNSRVAWHVSSHLESAEEKAYEMLYGLKRQLIGRKDDELPSIDEVKEVLFQSAERPPAVVVVEIPNRVLGCKTYSFSQLEELSSACKQAGVKLHCDGARLWEIEPYYQETAGKTFADIGQLFDSVYVSFYKGLRGAAGAMLVHDEESFIDEAKVWRRRAGGNAFTLFYEVIDCERGYNENIGTFKEKWDKMSDIVDGVTEATKKFRNGDGDAIVSFVPEQATCCQIRTVFRGYTVEELMAARDRAQDRTKVRVFDKVWPKQSLDEQAREERASKKCNGIEMPTKGQGTKLQEQDRSHIIEWMILEATLKVEMQLLVDAYVALCKELVAAAY